MRGRIRVLLVTNNYPPEVGSAAHLFFDLANGLASRDCEVRVVTALPRDYNMDAGGLLSRQPRGLIIRDKEESVEVIRILTPRIPKDSVFLRGLAMFVDPLFLAGGVIREHLSWHPDAVIVYSPPLPLAVLAVIGGKIRAVPVVANIQDLYPQTVIDVGLLKSRLSIRLFRWLERYVYNSSTIITVHSPGNKEYVSGIKSTPEEVRLVYNTSGAKPSKRENADWVSLVGENLTGRFVVTYAGVMAFHQGLDVVLDAAGLLKEHDDITFLMVGDGLEKERLVHRARDKELKNVIFRDFQSRDKYADLVTLSDAMLVTLRKDANPQVVPGKIQSIMQLGRPMIGSVPLNGDAARLIKDSNCGICCEPGNPDMLAEAILELKRDAKLREELGNDGLIFAERNFSFEVFVKAYMDILSEILSRQNASG